MPIFKIESGTSAMCGTSTNDFINDLPTMDNQINTDRLSLVLESIHAGDYELDVVNGTMQVSPRWKSLLGYEGHELKDLTAQSYFSWVHPDDLTAASHYIEAQLKEGKPFRCDLRIRSKSGTYKWFQDSGVPKPDGLTVIGTLINIDERKKTEEQLTLRNAQLAKTNEELDRFVYSASHDMRAPLSSMQGLIFLAEKASSPDEIKDCFDRMKSRVGVMEGFIRKLTDYSRNSRLQIDLKEIQLHDLIKEIIDPLVYSFNIGKIDVQNRVASDLSISSDPHRLRIILSNLFANAINYSDALKPKREIIIETVQSNTNWSLTVRDNGIGISEEHLPKIFDMFYRASDTSEGSGLGLYIVKETVNKLGGTISVQSKVGEGSDFTITLPCQESSIKKLLK